jgi:hypothetical protein
VVYDGSCSCELMTVAGMIKLDSTPAGFPFGGPWIGFPQTGIEG